MRYNKKNERGKEVFVSLQQVVPVVVIVVVFTRLTRNPFVFVRLFARICRRCRCPFVLFDCFGVVSDVLFVLLSFRPFKLLLLLLYCCMRRRVTLFWQQQRSVSRDLLAVWDLREGTGRDETNDYSRSTERTTEE